MTEVRRLHHPDCSYGATTGPAGDFCNCKMVVQAPDYDALAARAQAVENLRADLQSMTEARNSARAGSNGYHAERELLKRRLAAMTAEQERLQAQLAASQQKVRELETCQCEGCDNSLEGSAYCEPCFVKLQATLAEREARVKELEAAHFTELKERLRYTGEYRDVKRKVEQLVTDLDAARQDAARLRGILQAILNADERGQGLPFQEAMRAAYQEVKKTT